MKIKAFSFIAIVAATVIATGFTAIEQKAWTAPAADAKAVNTVKTSKESVAAGKALWNQHCSSCHGKTGLGDGSKAAQLKTQPADFSKAAFQSQTDGSLFYKVSVGRDDMPSFKKKIPEKDEIWNLVNFMRTLKK